MKTDFQTLRNAIRQIVQNNKIALNENEIDKLLIDYLNTQSKNKTSIQSIHKNLPSIDFKHIKQ